MKIENNGIWQRFVESRIVAKSSVEEIVRRIEAELNGDTNDQTVLEWLVRARLATPYHAKILAAGGSGPFVFGDYLVLGQNETGVLQGTFNAIHRPSGFHVLLDFATSMGDIETNGNGEPIVFDSDRVQKFVAVESPYIVPVFDSVLLADYAFVVSGVPKGTTLFEKVPRKARLPWQIAITIGLQIASVLEKIHGLGEVHGDLSTRNIWLDGKSHSRLRLPWAADVAFQEVDMNTNESSLDYLPPERAMNEPALAAGDFFSLGCVVLRLITGKSRLVGFSNSQKRAQLDKSLAVDWAKYDVPKPVAEILSRMLDVEPSRRPRDASEIVAAFVGDGVRPLSEVEELEPSDAYKKFAASLVAARSFWAAPEMIEPDAVQIQGIEEEKSISRATKSAKTPIDPESQHRLSETRRRKHFVLSAIGVLGFALLTAIVIWTVGKAQIENPNMAASKNEKQAVLNASVKSTEPQPAVSNLPANAALNQYLVEDDGERLWESPTNGIRSSFANLPANPRLIFEFHPSELVGIGQANLALQALTPELRLTLESWRTTTGLEFDDMRRVVVACYDGESKFNMLALVEFAVRVQEERMLSLWQATPIANDESSGEQTSRLFSSGDKAVWPMRSLETAGELDGFVIGPESLVREAAETGGLNTLDGVMSDIAVTVDSSRHINILFLTSSLFNEQGQDLMNGRWGAVNRELRSVMDEHVRGGVLSLHWDRSDVFVELSLEHSTDVGDSELVATTQEALVQVHEHLDQFAAALPFSTYWNRVRQRYDNMIDGWFRNLRVRAERGFVMANVWVPGTAVHNTIAAADLALAFSQGVVVESASPVPSDGPKSFEDVLAKNRRLQVTTNPDLNILIQNLQTEINADFPGLPYPFQIVINGNDLLVEGITKNQRPGDFEIVDKTLAEILTEICIRANPNKDAAGPSDLRCKLVWVVTADPTDRTRNIIQLTTRQAATERSWELPKAFGVENK